MEARANVVEQSQRTKKRKFIENGPNGGDNHKFNGKCYNCGIQGHRAKDCRRPCKGNENSNKRSFQANVTRMETLSDEVSELNVYC